MRLVRCVLPDAVAAAPPGVLWTAPGYRTAKGPAKCCTRSSQCSPRDGLTLFAGRVDPRLRDAARASGPWPIAQGDLSRLQGRAAEVGSPPSSKKYHTSRAARAAAAGKLGAPCALFCCPSRCPRDPQRHCALARARPRCSGHSPRRAADPPREARPTQRHGPPMCTSGRRAPPLAGSPRRQRCCLGSPRFSSCPVPAQAEVSRGRTPRHTSRRPSSQAEAGFNDDSATSAPGVAASPNKTRPSLTRGSAGIGGRPLAMAPRLRRAAAAHTTVTRATPTETPTAEAARIPTASERER